MPQHEPERSSTSDNLKLALFLNLGFTLLEIVGGLLTNSIAIVSDALHDLGDSLSLGMAWYLDRYAENEADEQFSFGYRRFSLLGALINAVTLIGGSIWVLRSAVTRLLDPEPAQAEGMILLAVLGIIINGFGAYRLHRNETLNARVAGWHLLEDVLGWTAVLVVSIILLFTDWYILDPLLSILITTYILISVISRLRQTVRLFLQAAPENVQLQDIRQTILQLEQVQNIHHMHLWSLDGDHHVLTAHVVVPPETTKKAASRLKRQLAHKIKLDNFEHVTIEIEYGQDDCRLPDGDASPKLA